MKAGTQAAEATQCMLLVLRDEADHSSPGVSSHISVHKDCNEPKEGTTSIQALTASHPSRTVRSYSFTE